MFILFQTEQAKEQLKELKGDKGLQKRYKSVVKTLRLLSDNPRHPGLHTHEYTTLKGPCNEKVFTAYAEGSTPAAYRIFWYYGPDKNQITIVSITSHP